CVRDGVDHHFASAGRVEHAFGFRSGNASLAVVRLRSVDHQARRYFLEWLVRWRVSDAGHAWCRSDDGAAISVRTRSEVGQLGVGNERFRCTRTVRTVSLDWSGAGRVLHDDR